MKVESWGRVKTETLRRYLDGIQAVLDERAGKPTERSVRGDLLIRFDADWPSGWSWPDHPLWGEGPTDEWPDEPGPPDPERFYDLSDRELEHEDGKRFESLWVLFKDWHDRQVGTAEDRSRDPRVLAEIEDFRAGASSLDDEQIFALRVCRTAASNEVDRLLDLIEKLSGITIKALDGEAKTP